MKITIMDYNSKETTVEVGFLDTIESIAIDVLSGDEVLTVFYIGGFSKVWDSSDCREFDFDDGCYQIYDRETGLDFVHDVEWLGRSDSYDFMGGQVIYTDDYEDWDF